MTQPPLNPLQAAIQAKLAARKAQSGAAQQEPPRYSPVPPGGPTPNQTENAAWLGQQPNTGAPATPPHGAPSGGFDYEAARALADSGSGSEFFQIEAGPSQDIALVMNVPPNANRFYEYGAKHFIPTNETPKGKPFSCPKSANNDAYCPACHAIDVLNARGDEQSKKIADQIGARRFFLSNAYVLDPQTGHFRHVILEYRMQVFKDVMDAIEAERPQSLGDGMFSNPLMAPNNPRIFAMSREGKGISTKYKAVPTGRTIQLSAQQIAERQDLSGFVTPSSAEEIMNAVYGYTGISGQQTVGAPPVTGGYQAPQSIPNNAPPMSGYASGAAATAPVAGGFPAPLPVTAPMSGMSNDANLYDDIPDCIGDYDPALAVQRNCSICKYAENCQSVQGLG